MPRTARKVPEVGERFGRWLVVARAPSPPNGAANWLCRCDCGAERSVLQGNLISGRSTGCRRHSTEGQFKPTHALSHGRLWRTWTNMLQRCHNPNCKSWADYGGRGIVVCDRWRHSVASFAEDMGEPPSASHTLDRIDNDGPYSPENCRWATRVEQQMNTRRVRLVTIDGTTLPLAEWARRSGMPRQLLWGRIQAGWPEERWLTPARGR